MLTKSFILPADLPAMFANSLPAKTTILDKTPCPTYLQVSPFLKFLRLDEKFVPHSSSTPQINASPKLHLLTDDVG